MNNNQLESFFKNIQNQYSQGTLKTKENLSEVPEELTKLFLEIQKNKSHSDYLKQSKQIIILFSIL